MLLRVPLLDEIAFKGNDHILNASSDYTEMKLVFTGLDQVTAQCCLPKHLLVKDPSYLVKVIVSNITYLWDQLWCALFAVVKWGFKGTGQKRQEEEREQEQGETFSDSNTSVIEMEGEMALLNLFSAVQF